MSPVLSPKLVVEGIGTFLLCLVAVVSRDAAAIGVTLMVMIYAGRHVSGGYFNPAVTTALFLRGKISRAEGTQYLMAQGVAAIAAVIVSLIWRQSAGMPAAEFTFKTFCRAFSGEIIGTFALAYVVLNVATTKAMEGNQFYGAAIGLTVFAMASTFAGAAFNPAVALTQALTGAANGAVIVTSLLGGVIGAFVAAYVVNLVQAEADGRTAPKSVTAPANSTHES